MLLGIETHRNDFCLDFYVMSSLRSLSFIIVEISLELTKTDGRWSEEDLDEGSVEEAIKRHITDNIQNVPLLLETVIKLELQFPVERKPERSRVQFDLSMLVSTNPERI